MKIFTLTFLSSIITLGTLIPIAASASHSKQGDVFYIGTQLGFTQLADINTTATPPNTGGIALKQKRAIPITAILGYQHGHYIGELVYTWLNNQVETTAIKEKLKDYTLMVRGAYSIKMSNPKLHPYFGVQIGIYKNNPNKITYGNGNNNAFSKGSAFAYGGMIGFDYKLTDNLYLNAELDHVSSNLIKNHNTQYSINYNLFLIGLDYSL